MRRLMRVVMMTAVSLKEEEDISGESEFLRGCKNDVVCACAGYSQATRELYASNFTLIGMTGGGQSWNANGTTHSSEA